MVVWPRAGGGLGLQGQTRELMRQEGEIEEERRLAAKMLAEARTTAPRLATMSSITEHRNRWVAYKVFRGGEGVWVWVWVWGAKLYSCHSRP